MKTKAGILAAIGLTLLLASCKPTENNYKAAYDAALSKREKAESDMLVPSGGGFVREGAPRPFVTDGDTVYYSRMRLRVADGEKMPDRYSVVVGKYKMVTNAKAQAADLLAKGYGSLAAEGDGKEWYVIASSFPTMKEASGFMKKFVAENRDYPFIGLDGAPFIIEKW